MAESPNLASKWYAMRASRWLLARRTNYRTLLLGSSRSGKTLGAKCASNTCWASCPVDRALLSFKLLKVRGNATKKGEITGPAELGHDG
jgi:hypothetical protein